MERVILKVKSKSQIDELSKYGSILFVSPVLNIISIEVKEENLNEIINNINVISYSMETTGELMPSIC